MPYIEPALRFVEVATVLFGVVLLVVGYRRNQRKIMAAAGMALMAAGAFGHFADNFDQRDTTALPSVTSTAHP